MIGKTSKKRTGAWRTLLVCLLCATLAGVLCGCLPGLGEPSETTGETEPSGTSGETEPSQETTGGAESETTKDPTEGMIPLTRDGTALCCVVYESGNTESNELARAFCTRLEEKTGKTIAFSKVGSENYEARIDRYEFALVSGTLEGICDDLYATVSLRNKDSAVVRDGKRIGLLGYTDEAIIYARSLFLDNLIWQNGTLYLDPAVFGKVRVGNYDIGEMRVGETALGSYSILTDAETAQAGEQLGELLTTYGGYLLPVTTDASAAGERYLAVDTDAARNCYRISAEGKGLRFSYDGTVSTLKRLLLDVEKKLKGVSYGAIYKMEDLIMEHQISDTVKYLTLNVLASGKDDPGERDDLAAKMILSELPDFFGLQEFDTSYRKGGETNFKTLISEYYAEATPDGIPLSDVWTPVFYRKDLYDLVESGYTHFHEYLSPSESAEYGYGGGTTDRRTHNRGFAWAVVADKASGQRYLIASFHYGITASSSPNVAVSDQIKESNLIIRLFKELSERFGNIPSLICGDYNSTVSGVGYGAWNMLQNGFKDTWTNAATRTDIGTCHTLGQAQGGTYASAIDHIFTLSDLDVRSYITLTSPELLNCSDHCPTVVEIAKPTADQ